MYKSLFNSGISSKRTYDGRRAHLPLHQDREMLGVNMRELFILVALVFALVTGATANVVATTLQSQITTGAAGR
jgi:hypothetical protein